MPTVRPGAGGRRPGAGATLSRGSPGDDPAAGSPGWEFAARGPEALVYPSGEAYDTDRANVTNTIGPKPVGSYPTGISWVGATDMAGNAMEWVADWLDPAYYATSPGTDPVGPPSGSIKVEKGGWWGSNPFVARSAYRHYEDPPTYGDKHIGFRVASP